MTTLDPLVTQETDLYLLLNVERNAQDTEIKRAYRKTALKYHPDKNPSKDAAEKFHFLAVALETLTTPSLRARYDQIRNAFIEAKLRTASYDAERRRMKQDLEAREQAAAGLAAKTTDLKRKVDELKKEGANLRKMRDEEPVVEAVKVSESLDDESTRMVLLKWREVTTTISQERLETLLSSFGSIDMVRIRKNPGSSKRRTAVIIFNQRSSAQACALLLADPSVFASRDPFYSTIRSVSYKSDKDAAEDLTASTGPATPSTPGTPSTPATVADSVPQVSPAAVPIAMKLAALRSRIQAQRSQG